ncbi:hypothetical protein [Armatimonas sp.]|uniref:hypothetical protein n=1 Tax=Armatimonas sp. TaxID=1872638 RepID=UPI00375034B2
MSTLTQRFLTELDGEWGHLPDSEQQSLKEQIMVRLETLVAIERELGASDEEAQRRAVRAVGEEGILRPPTRIRLSPHWQVALVWTALGGLVSEGVFFLNPFINQLNAFVPLIYVRSGLVTPLTAALTTWLAFRWHPRGARRGVLYGLGIWLIRWSLQLVLAYYVYRSPTPESFRQEQLGSLLIHEAAYAVATLGTLWALQKMRRKKLPKSL